MEASVDLYLAVPLLFTILAVILASLFVKLRTSQGDKAAAAAAAAAQPPVQETQAGSAAQQGDGGEKKIQGGLETPGEEPQGSKVEEEEGVPEAEGRVSWEEIGAGEEKKEEKREQQGKRWEEAEEAVDAAPQTRTAVAEQQSHPQHEKMPSQAAATAAAAAAVEVEEEQQEEEEEEDEEEEEEEEESKEEDQESENEKLVLKEPETEEVDEQFSFKYSPGKLRGNQYKTMMTKEELEEEQRVQREQLIAIFNLMKEKAETFGDMSETDIKEQLKLYDM